MEWSWISFGIGFVAGAVGIVVFGVASWNAGE